MTEKPDDLEELAKAVLELIKECGDDPDEALRELVIGVDHAELHHKIMGAVVDGIHDTGEWPLTRENRHNVLVFKSLKEQLGVEDL